MMVNTASSMVETVLEQSGELIRFPLDGLLRVLKQPGCYCLGVTAMVDGEAASHGNRVGSIARQCAERTGRKTLWVCGSADRGGSGSMVPACRNTDPAEEESSEAIPVAAGSLSDGSGGVDRLHWSCLGEALVLGTSAFRQAMAELAGLPQLRQRYALIVIDLGGLNQAGVERVGKLCDGVVVVCDTGRDASRTGSKRLARSAKAIRQGQHEGVRFIGAWSLLAVG